MINVVELLRKMVQVNTYSGALAMALDTSSTFPSIVW